MTEVYNLFTKMLDNIDAILNNEFYYDKCELLKIKEKINGWFDSYKISNSLISIKFQDVEWVHFEITELFDKYVSVEPVSENYTEVLYYCTILVF